MSGRTLTAVGGTALAGLLLAGCATDPRAELHAGVEAVTHEANQRDAGAVRQAVEDLLARIDAALQDGTLSAAEAEQMRNHALAVQAGADSIDDDLIARREAEQAAQEAQRQLEAERAANADAERKRLEEEAKRAEEEAKKAEEEAKKAEEEAKKGKDDDEEDGDRASRKGRG